MNRASLMASAGLAVLWNAGAAEANPYYWGGAAAQQRPPAYIYQEPVRRPPRNIDFFERPAPRTTTRTRTYVEPEWSYPKRRVRTIESDERSTRSTRSSRTRTRTEEPAVVTTTRTIIKDEKPNKPVDVNKPVDANMAVPKGQLHIIVSVDQQRASLYANGAYVASTKVSTGTKTHPTPMGVFSVIQKNRHHVSNLYGSPMPYMQRLTWSGTALHTGPLPGYPASHGCIRLTNDFAQMLWKATKLGARVIVTRDDVKPSEIAHARLNFPKPAPEAAPAMSDATGSVPNAIPVSARSTATASYNIIIDPALNTPSAAERKLSGPVSIFISRKDSKLYVRQAMQPLFDIPLTLTNPADPIGTHVYTAMEEKDGTMRWTAVSVPSAFTQNTGKVEVVHNGRKTTRVETTGSAHRQAPVPDAAAALDRFELPQHALDRLTGLMTPGSSLIVSDNALSHETGKGTDFIILTR